MCCECCCCKTKKPKGGGKGGKGGKKCGTGGGGTGGGNTTFNQGALCGQASALVGHGGNTSIDALNGLQQIGGGTSPNPMMGMYQGEMLAEGGLAHLAGGGDPSTKEKCSSNYFECIRTGLKKNQPKFVCDKEVTLRPIGSANKPELKSLSQIKPSIIGSAEGGLAHAYHAAAPKGHNPEFITGLTGYYACGGGTGQSDDIPAMLHDGDYVMDAETVSALGDGSSKAGMHVLEGFRHKVPHKEEIGKNPVPAKIADGEYVFPASFVTALGQGDNKKGSEILDGLREKLREHKRKAPLDSIPPKAKTPIDYIKKGKK